MLNLIEGFLAHGRRVDLVLCQAKGAYLGEIPVGATMIELQATGDCRPVAARHWAIAATSCTAAPGFAGEQDRPGDLASYAPCNTISKHIVLT